MKKLILPLILLLIGVGGGVGAGLMLMPPADDEMMTANPCGDGYEAPETFAATILSEDPVPLDQREYARMNNQFVVPVVVNKRVASLIVMSLSIEVEIGGQNLFFRTSPSFVMRFYR